MLTVALPLFIQAQSQDSAQLSQDTAKLTLEQLNKKYTQLNNRVIKSSFYIDRAANLTTESYLIGIAAAGLFTASFFSANIFTEADDAKIVLIGLGTTLSIVSIADLFSAPANLRKAAKCLNE